MENNNIKIVSVEFKIIKVNKFLPKEKRVEFSVFFNDGDNKEILRSIDLNSIGGVAENIINDIVDMEKNINKEFNGEILLENSVNVIIKNKEGLLPKINDFLKKVSENIDKVRAHQSSDGYLNLVNNVNNMKLEF